MVWLLPIITGISSVLWAYLLKSSSGGILLASGADWASKFFIIPILLWYAPTELKFDFSPIVLVAFAIEIVLCVAITVLWAYPMQRGVTLPTAALAEIGYPFVAIAMSFLVFRSEQLTGIQWIGGALSISGALLVSIGAKGA